jgi:4-diphosphocytidyl-2-C-methyl-D-erythritol kinase
MSQSVLAPAKLNLFLHVGDKRADGYHPLQSLAVFPALGDVVTAEEADTLSLSVTGPFAAALSGEGDNLVLKAARALAAKIGRAPAARLSLVKNLPVASGIGGGSADAAATLRALSELWQLDLNDVDLPQIAAGLGSDVPVCLASMPCWMEGRGEILSPIAAMPHLPILLVNPGVAVPTPPVFAGLRTRSGVARKLPPGRFQDMADLLRLLDDTKNDLEGPARALQPVIGDVLTALAALPGALFARMSGSGATCYALFPDDDSCRNAAGLLAKAHSDWWIAPSAVTQFGMGQAQIGQDIGPTPDGL